jgi:hypothetical protein
VAITAILALAFGEKYTVSDIVDLFNHKDNEGVGGESVSNFINQNFGDKFHADNLPVSQFFNQPSDINGMGNWIQREIKSNSILLVIAESDQYGNLIVDRYTGHWVIITGISSEWEDNDLSEFDYDPNMTSHWNWVRIFNPFKADTQYYWWGKFYQSWRFEQAAVRVSLKE